VQQAPTYPLLCTVPQITTVTRQFGGEMMLASLPPNYRPVMSMFNKKCIFFAYASCASLRSAKSSVASCMTPLFGWKPFLSIILLTLYGEGGWRTMCVARGWSSEENSSPCSWWFLHTFVVNMAIIVARLDQDDHISLANLLRWGTSICPLVMCKGSADRVPLAIGPTRAVPWRHDPWKSSQW
jgi:hypothetical protein